MPAKTKKIDDISREEDFRDYDDRNIDEGWPYDDAAGAGARAVDNTAYGQPAANFDRERNPGYRIENADADGAEQRLRDGIFPETIGREDADDLEERITDRLLELDIVEIDSIDLHVESGKVTLEGVVDERATSQRIVREVEKIDGVRAIVNNLRLAGVDSRIPNED